MQEETARKFFRKIDGVEEPLPLVYAQSNLVPSEERFRLLTEYRHGARGRMAAEKNRMYIRDRRLVGDSTFLSYEPNLCLKPSSFEKVVKDHCMATDLTKQSKLSLPTLD